MSDDTNETNPKENADASASKTSETNGAKTCCSKPSGVKRGLACGLIPHAGCIAVILLSIFSVTAGTTLLAPILKTEVFYGLIVLSFTIATVSAAYYLKKHSCLCKRGMRKEWKYLATLYGTTIAVNAILMLVIFPALGTFAASTGGTGLVTAAAVPAVPLNLANLTISVDIPCGGHAPLITSSVKALQGVISIQYSAPNRFTVTYDTSQVSREQILALGIFKDYPATIAG